MQIMRLVYHAREKAQQRRWISLNLWNETGRTTVPFANTE